MFVFRSVHLPINKEFCSSMRVIYGIGKYKSFYISTRLALAFPTRLAKLNYYKSLVLSFVLHASVKERVKLERVALTNIMRLIDSYSYRGKRHRDNLPCRGQRTRTNASTRKRQRLTRGLIL